MKVSVDGARFLGVDQAMAAADLVVSMAFFNLGFNCRITSGMEGAHRKNSLHYSGGARDYGLHDIPAYDRLVIRDSIKTALGPDYDVVLEGDPPHIHVEWQPEVSL